MAISSIVLDDDAATPVAHTFVASRTGIDPKGDQVAQWTDRSQAAPVGFWTITSKMSAPTPARPTWRLELALNEPILANITNSTVTGVEPAPEVAYVTRAQATLILPQRGSLQSRKDIQKMFANLLANAQVAAMIEDLSMPLG